MTKTLAAVLLLCAAPAAAHCPVSYVLTGPGGLAWQINLGGVTADGVLPGGTTSRLGPVTTWADTRREGQTTGLLTVGHVFTDGTRYAVCPPVKINLSDPALCSEDGETGEINHPNCTPHFVAALTAAGALTCSSSCRPGTYPAPQAYTPAPSAAASVSSLSPARARAGGPALALTVSGSGFGGDSLVLWNGAPLTTAFVNAGSLAALVPASLLSAGSARVAVWNPGSVSAETAFEVDP